MNNNNLINNINVQLAFQGALLVANTIFIYATYLYKQMIENPSSNRQAFLKTINDLGLLTANIFLIVTIYFFLLAYEVYHDEPTQANFDYYMAASLSFCAQSIRVNTLNKYPLSESSSADIL